MMHWRSLVPGFGAAALLLAPQALFAQLGFELGPTFGVYAEPGDFQSSPLSDFSGTVTTSRQGTGFLIGASGTAWLGPRIGLTLQWGTARSTVRSRNVSATEAQLPSRITLGAVQAVLRIPLTSMQGQVQAGAGLGVVRRSGEFYEDYETPSNMAGVLSLGTRYALGERARVSLGLDSYLYSFSLRRDDGVEFDSSFQTDLTARIGLSWFLQP